MVRWSVCCQRLGALPPYFVPRLPSRPGMAYSVPPKTEDGTPS